MQNRSIEAVMEYRGFRFKIGGTLTTGTIQNLQTQKKIKYHISESSLEKMKDPETYVNEYFHEMIATLVKLELRGDKYAQAQKSKKEGEEKEEES